MQEKSVNCVSKGKPVGGEFLVEIFEGVRTEFWDHEVVLCNGRQGRCHSVVVLAEQSKYGNGHLHQPRRHPANPGRFAQHGKGKFGKRPVSVCDRPPPTGISAYSPVENLQRIRDAGVEDGVFPLHADARSLPFAPDFFDAVVCVDAFYYFGTDALYLNYLAHFVKVSGQIGMAGAGLVQEIEGPVPDHLREWWTQDCWAFHSASWWRQHWERTGIMDVELADTMPDGWPCWLDWQRAVAPDNATEIQALEADGGKYLGYVRLVGRRRGQVKLEEYCWPDTLRSLPPQYTKKPLLCSREA